jgi:hypothetical protein
MSKPFNMSLGYVYHTGAYARQVTVNTDELDCATQDPLRLHFRKQVSAPPSHPCFVVSTCMRGMQEVIEARTSHSSDAPPVLNSPAHAAG